MTPRRRLLGAALAATALATAWAAWQDDALDTTTVVAATVRAPGNASRALPLAASSGVPPVQGAAPERRLAPRAVPDALASSPRAQWPRPSDSALAAWSPPTPPAPPTSSAASLPVPERPSAPPFPYQWIGGVDDGGVAAVYLASPRRTAVLRPGESLDGVWRFDAPDPGGTRLTFTWLPGEQPITVEARR